MPNYDYKCSKCDEQFELFHSIHDEPVKECIRCGAKNNVQRLISGTVGISFKGPGFYVTDSQKPASTAASDSN